MLNSSRTVPAVLRADWVIGGVSTPIEVRLAHRCNDWEWEALLLAAGVEDGDRLVFSPLLEAVITANSAKSPLRKLQFNMHGTKQLEQIYTLGQPIRYEYIAVPWSLDYYQTVFATEPGSVEMPSAGRAFSWELLLKLQRKGVQVAYIQLHTGLSYWMDDNWHQEPQDNLEQYTVPQETVEAIKRSKAGGGRVIAVGTTVVRSLESAVDDQGNPQALSGWTNLFINDEYPLQIVDGLITGFHEPQASHLQLLSAIVPKDLLFRSYHEAIEQRYLWHEFGDMNLIL